MCPDLFALLEEGEHELVFGGEVPVERGLRDSGALDRLVDPDVMDAAAREELVCGLEDAVASAQYGFRTRGSVCDHRRAVRLRETWRVCPLIKRSG
jgi:hypothetical protein